VLEALQEGGKIPEGEDLNALEAEMMANQAATQAAEQQAAQDALRLKQASGGAGGSSGMDGMAA
jgi:hypothetical protein